MIFNLIRFIIPQIIDQCYFQYGFGSRMVPCCFTIISREEYDRLVEFDPEHTMAGGAWGKHHSCPKNVEEAQQILAGNSYIQVYEKYSLNLLIGCFLPHRRNLQIFLF